jgi:hypothetical protein
MTYFRVNPWHYLSDGGIQLNTLGFIYEADNM